ncbi:MAG TPA: hypothetical protein DCY13_20115, partial [Verrucomicrobiales bacterium]|nr:hypothetical protein [Verrucomicrobiales bacterium]
MNQLPPKSPFHCVAVPVFVLLACAFLPAQAQNRKQVTTADDLPRITYPVAGSATELVTDAAKFEPFADKVRGDIEKILAEHEIADKATLKQFKGT